VTDVGTVAITMLIFAQAGGQDTTTVTDAPAIGTFSEIASGVGIDSTTVTDAVTLQMSRVLLTLFDTIIASDVLVGQNNGVLIGTPTVTGRLTAIAGTSGGAVIA